MEFRFAKHADFRRTFTWRDENGVIIEVADAFAQAKNSAGTTVIDLRWFSQTPTEETVVALPGAQRGYLAPYEGTTLEMHVSNANTVPPGTYAFDLYVKSTNSGDWERLVAGTIIVEAATSTPPV